MTEFVGRTGSLRVYSYPETRRASGAAVPFARNFATVKGGAQSILAAGTLIVWDPIDVGISPSSNVRITPLSTGVVAIRGVLTIENEEVAQRIVTVAILVDGAPLPGDQVQEIIPAGGIISIPFLTQATMTLAAHQISVEVFSSLDALQLEGGTIEVQEVPTPTG